MELNWNQNYREPIFDLKLSKFCMDILYTGKWWKTMRTWRLWIWQKDKQFIYKRKDALKNERIYLKAKEKIQVINSKDYTIRPRKETIKIWERRIIWGTSSWLIRKTYDGMEIHKGIYEKLFTVRHSEGKSLTNISTRILTEKNRRSRMKTLNYH